MVEKSSNDLEFKVGEVFPLPPYAGEGAVFSVEPYTMMLIYYFSKPMPEEIEEFNKGKVSFAVSEVADVMFVLSRFGRMNWCDAPYSAALASVGRSLPELGEQGTGYAVDAFMVDLDTNRLAAHRLVRLSAPFSNGFKKIFDANKQLEMTEAGYQKAVAKVYEHFSVQDLLRGAKISMQ